MEETGEEADKVKPEDAEVEETPVAKVSTPVSVKMWKGCRKRGGWGDQSRPTFRFKKNLLALVMQRTTPQT